MVRMGDLIRIDGRMCRVWNWVQWETSEEEPMLTVDALDIEAFKDGQRKLPVNRTIEVPYCWFTPTV